MNLSQKLKNLKKKQIIFNPRNKMKKEMSKKEKAVYEGWAIVNRPSNEFFVLFKADKEEAERIMEKIVPIVGKLQLVKVRVVEE